MQKLAAERKKIIHYKWASPSDLLNLLKLHEETKASWSHPKEFFEEAIQYQRVLLSLDSDTTIGYLLFEIIWGNTPFLSLVRILPTYRRQGIATSLVKLFEHHLFSLNYKSYVTSTEMTNLNAKACMPKTGFKEIGILQMAHGEEVFYLKELDI